MPDEDASRLRLRNGGDPIPALDPQWTVVELAHFTVQEYLESEHIKGSKVKFFALPSSSLTTDFSLNIMRRVLSIGPNLLDDARWLRGTTTPGFPMNSEYYLIYFVLSLVTFAYRPKRSPGFDGLNLLIEDEKEILQLVLKFLHPKSAPTLFLTRLCNEIRRQTTSLSNLERYQALLHRSYRFPRQLARALNIGDESVLTPATPNLIILWKLLGVYNIQAGLKALEILEDHECREVLTEKVKIRINYDLLHKWRSSTDAKHVEPFGTLPEIFAESQFTMNYGVKRRAASNRLRSLVGSERLRSMLNLTTLLGCYIYSHTMDCESENQEVSSDASYCLLERLLEGGADPNGGDMRMTPLQVAAQRWDYEAIKLLLENGADANAIGVEGGRTCAGWQLEYADWSPLRIYRRDIALFRPLYFYDCWNKDDGKHHPYLPPHHETLCCQHCGALGTGTPESNYYKRCIERRHLQADTRAEIEQLLVSKGAREF
ncbi:hypothetical protein TWF481_007406 [Arthrobotrys musiformis]|uniref:Uncharacterized protein n=1 Tax=Arthrobotrys musiformis TaxID=47236 RepID=A0AAV9WC86_9PEZI